MNYINVIKVNKWLVLILVIAAILRLYHLDFQSPWLDEIHTLNEANPNLSFKEVYASLMTSEQMPPLYFYMIYFLFKVFGYTTFFARLLSAILGIMSVYGIYKLGNEIINKKTGFVAAFLLTINSFHIYYSQDARPYILLFILSIYSFIYLVKFLKSNNIKNALQYGVIVGLMLLSHFFGLFVLFSQLFILLFFFILIEKEKRFRFFKLSILAGIIVILFFLPALHVFIKLSEIKVFWIPAPTIDAYTLIFKEFFGNSETILALLGMFILMYFIRLTKEKNTSYKYSEIISNNIILSFIILMPWIFIVLLVPLIRSYISVPMIISRYFIVVLPALLVIVSIGIIQFKNKIIQFSLIGIVFIFSLTDIVIVKKYYMQPNKSQFREAYEFVKNNSNNKEIVYSSLSWYFNYYFKESKVIDKPLNEIINETKNDTTKLKSFWYVNAHGNKFEIPKENEQFFNDKYVIDKNFEGFDAWAKHFIPKKLINNQFKLDKFRPFNKDFYGTRIKSWIEKVDQNENNISIGGWAFLENIPSNNSSIYVVLIKDKREKIYLSSMISRPDITTVERKGIDYNNSGFEIKILRDELEKGKYKIGLYIQNNNINGMIITNKELFIN